jgi:hypothetical protein
MKISFPHWTMPILRLAVIVHNSTLLENIIKAYYTIENTNFLLFSSQTII